MFKETSSRYKQIDIVCNNAGIMHEGKWEEMIDINLVSAIKGQITAELKYTWNFIKYTSGTTHQDFCFLIICGTCQMVINLFQSGVIYGTKLAMQHMGRSNGGNGGLIVNIASIAGLYIQWC